MYEPGRCSTAGYGQNCLHKHGERRAPSAVLQSFQSFQSAPLLTLARLTLISQMASDFPFHDKIKVTLPLLMEK